MSHSAERKKRNNPPCTARQPEVERKALCVFADPVNRCVGIQLGDEQFTLSGDEAFEMSIALARATFHVGMRETEDNAWTVPLPTDAEASQVLEQVLAEGLANGEIEQCNGAYRLTKKGRQYAERLNERLGQM